MFDSSAPAGRSVFARVLAAAATLAVFLAHGASNVEVHHYQKYVFRGTSPPSPGARDAGREGADDGAKGMNWKNVCEGCVP